MSKLYETGTDIVTLSYLRDMRDDLLQDCDWTQMPDSPLSDSKKNRVGYLPTSTKGFAFKLYKFRCRCGYSMANRTKLI